LTHSSGDIFDSANPPATAQGMLYRFLAEARQAVPDLDIVMIGGNHDSPARLEAPDPILRHFKIRMLGTLPRSGAAIDPEAAIVPLRDRNGDVSALLAAVPYLRLADLPRNGGGADPLVDGVRSVYAEVLAAARARRSDGQALLATGHCYMVGTKLSELSERRILGGNQHALPDDTFPKDVAYVGLGHLHLVQVVHSRAYVRYSGSPIPLSMAEVTYQHQVCVVELKGDQLSDLRVLKVPRSVELLRLPKDALLPLDEVIAQLEALNLHPGDDERVWPYLEVRVLLDKPEPDLRARVEECLDGRPVRLVKLTSHYSGSGPVLADQVSSQALDDIDEDEVFLRCYRQKYEGDPTKQLLEAFHELVEAARQEKA